MNDSEIRERVREAVGEAQYPPDLPGRVQAQLKAPRRESAHPRAIELIAAYADAARTVLFFRMTPDAGLPMASIDDAYGFLNASSSGSRGVPGDYVFALNAGPRPGIDGIAHLKVLITGVQPIGPGASTQGHWTFAPDVHVQGSQPIGSYPLHFALGSWKVTLEVIELTPSVVHVQALIDGATVGDVEQKFMTLVDSSGHEVRQIAGGASVTVPQAAAELEHVQEHSGQRPVGTSGGRQIQAAGGGQQRGPRGRPGNPRPGGFERQGPIRRTPAH